MLLPDLFSRVIFTWMKKALLISLAVVVSLFVIFLVLLFTGIIWRSPSRYNCSRSYSFVTPVMSMSAYGDLLKDHERPYIFSCKKGKGSVTVLGIEHTVDPHDPQIDSIQKYWDLNAVTFVRRNCG